MISEFQLLLVTDRPAIHAFFISLRLDKNTSFAVNQVPVDAEALSLVSERNTLAVATIAVVDVLLTPPAAVQLCQALHAHRAEMPISALCCCPRLMAPSLLHKLIAAGVGSLLDLQATADEMARALLSIASGGVVLHLQMDRDHSELLGNLLANGKSSGDMHPSGLSSATDARLVELVAYGLSDGEIGKRLHLSSHTVKHRIERLRHEVNVANRVELAAWAGQHGFYLPSTAPDYLDSQGNCI